MDLHWYGHVGGDGHGNGVGRALGYRGPNVQEARKECGKQ